MAELLRGGLCTAVVSPSGAYLAGPLPPGEDIAVAEIDLSEIARQKSLLDTTGHYARPDILRLWLDDRPRRVVEKTASRPGELLDEDGDGDDGIPGEG